jgi:two-component sensor histidine kinase
LITGIEKSVIPAVSGSFRVKVILITIAIIIAIGTLFYTQFLVQKLQARERESVELYAESLQYIIESDANTSEYTFILENVIKRIDFPLILTDADDNISLTGIDVGIRNIPFDSTMSNEALLNFLNAKVIELSNEHDPIIVNYSDSLILGKIYYGDSEIVKQLRYYPYLQIFIALIFVLTAYVVFNYLKKTEQSNIWVGMSKETAHQLGTPISSLMGWNELLNMNYKDSVKVLDITEEMKNDLDRLNKIAQRFSKIGSLPELKEHNIKEVIERVILYFQRRLPQTGKKNVKITLETDTIAFVKLNTELFEWVLENLIKNSLDAIELKSGRVEFKVFDYKKYIEIEITDNGKGIDPKKKKDVFKPGVTTKKRGWGLGLSLSKRIVEDYHKGKIFVKTSEVNIGTTFKITLPK